MKQTILEAAEAVVNGERDPIACLALFRDIEDALKKAIDMVIEEALSELSRYPREQVILGDYQYKTTEITRYKFPDYEPLKRAKAEVKKIEALMKASDLNTYDGEGEQIPMAVKYSTTSIVRTKIKTQ